MRRPGKVSGGGAVEMVSVAGAKKAIFDADVVVLVIDAAAGASDQDAAIGGEADRAGRGIVIVANKWDLVKDRGPDYSRCSTRPRGTGCGFSTTRPSSTSRRMTGERTPKVLETIDKIAHTRRMRVPTPELNKFVEAVTAANPPVSPGSNTRPHPLRGADRRGAAVVCLLHQRRHDAAFLVRAVPREQAAREVRVRRHADPHPGAPPGERGRASQGSAGANERGRKGRRREKRGTGRTGQTGSEGGKRKKIKKGVD